jgi:hypothetical protein
MLNSENLTLALIATLVIALLIRGSINNRTNDIIDELIQKYE